jgi:micrococcal nuclease
MSETVSARVEEVVDGDTLDVVCNLGFGLRFQTTIRLIAVDTHETYGESEDSEEYRRGIKEKRFVEGWIAEAERAASSRFPLDLKIYEKGGFGRWLAEVSDGDEVLNQRILDKFDGVKYND